MPRILALLALLTLVVASPSRAQATGAESISPAASVPAPAASPELADVPPPPADKAQIVFLKPARARNGANTLGLFELEGAQPRLLGVLTEDARLAVEVPAGKHRFLSHLPGNDGLAGNAHVLEAEVEAGKRYFVVARYLYLHGFQLRPARPGTGPYGAGTPEFARWIADTKVRQSYAYQKKWYSKAANAQALEFTQGKAEQAWQRKTDAQRAELTLQAVDAL